MALVKVQKRKKGYGTGVCRIFSLSLNGAVTNKRSPTEPSGSQQHSSVSPDSGNKVDLEIGDSENSVGQTCVASSEEAEENVPCLDLQRMMSSAGGEEASTDKLLDSWKIVSDSACKKSDCKTVNDSQKSEKDSKTKKEGRKSNPKRSQLLKEPQKWMAKDSGMDSVLALSVSKDSGTNSIQVLSMPNDSVKDSVLALSVAKDSGTDSVQALFVSKDSGTDCAQAVSVSEDSGTYSVAALSVAKDSRTDSVQALSLTKVSGADFVQALSVKKDSGTDSVQALPVSKHSGIDSVQALSGSKDSGTDSVQTLSVSKHSRKDSVQALSLSKDSGTDCVPAFSVSKDSGTDSVQALPVAKEPRTDSVNSLPLAKDSGTDSVQNTKTSATLHSQNLSSTYRPSGPPSKINSRHRSSTKKGTKCQSTSCKPPPYRSSNSQSKVSKGSSLPPSHVSNHLPSKSFSGLQSEHNGHFRPRSEVFHRSSSVRSHPPYTASSHPSFTFRSHPSSTFRYPTPYTASSHPSSTFRSHPSPTFRSHPPYTASSRPSSAFRSHPPSSARSNPPYTASSHPSSTFRSHPHSSARSNPPFTASSCPSSTARGRPAGTSNFRKSSAVGFCQASSATFRPSCSANTRSSSTAIGLSFTSHQLSTVHASFKLSSASSRRPPSAKSQSFSVVNTTLTKDQTGSQDQVGQLDDEDWNNDLIDVFSSSLGGQTDTGYNFHRDDFKVDGVSTADPVHSSSFRNDLLGTGLVRFDCDSVSFNSTSQTEETTLNSASVSSAIVGLDDKHESVSGEVLPAEKQTNGENSKSDTSGAVCKQPFARKRIPNREQGPSQSQPLITQNVAVEAPMDLGRVVYSQSPNASSVNSDFQKFTSADHMCHLSVSKDVAEDERKEIITTRQNDELGENGEGIVSKGTSESCNVAKSMEGSDQFTSVSNAEPHSQSADGSVSSVQTDTDHARPTTPSLLAVSPKTNNVDEENWELELMHLRPYPVQTAEENSGDANTESIFRSDQSCHGVFKVQVECFTSTANVMSTEQDIPATNSDHRRAPDEVYNSCSVSLWSCTDRADDREGGQSLRQNSLEPAFDAKGVNVGDPILDNTETSYCNTATVYSKHEKCSGSSTGQFFKGEDPQMLPPSVKHNSISAALICGDSQREVLLNRETDSAACAGKNSKEEEILQIFSHSGSVSSGLESETRLNSEQPSYPHTMTPTFVTEFVGGHDLETAEENYDTINSEESERSALKEGHLKPRRLRASFSEHGRKDDPCEFLSSQDLDSELSLPESDSLSSSMGSECGDCRIATLSQSDFENGSCSNQNDHQKHYSDFRASVEQGTQLSAEMSSCPEYISPEQAAADSFPGDYLGVHAAAYRHPAYSASYTGQPFLLPYGPLYQPYFPLSVPCYGYPFQAQDSNPLEGDPCQNCPPENTDAQQGHRFATPSFLPVWQPSFGVWDIPVLCIPAHLIQTEDSAKRLLDFVQKRARGAGGSADVSFEVLVRMRASDFARNKDARRTPDKSGRAMRTNAAPAYCLQPCSVHQPPEMCSMQSRAPFMSMEGGAYLGCRRVCEPGDISSSGDAGSRQRGKEAGERRTEPESWMFRPPPPPPPTPPPPNPPRPPMAPLRPGAPRYFLGTRAAQSLATDSGTNRVRQTDWQSSYADPSRPVTWGPGCQLHSSDSYPYASAHHRAYSESAHSEYPAYWAAPQSEYSYRGHRFMPPASSQSVYPVPVRSQNMPGHQSWSPDDVESRSASEKSCLASKFNPHKSSSRLCQRERSTDPHKAYDASSSDLDEDDTGSNLDRKLCHQMHPKRPGTKYQQLLLDGISRDSGSDDLDAESGENGGRDKKHDDFPRQPTLEATCDALAKHDEHPQKSEKYVIPQKRPAPGLDSFLFKRAVPKHGRGALRRSQTADKEQDRVSAGSLCELERSGTTALRTWDSVRSKSAPSLGSFSKAAAEKGWQGETVVDETEYPALSESSSAHQPGGISYAKVAAKNCGRSLVQTAAKILKQSSEDLTQSSGDESCKIFLRGARRMSDPNFLANSSGAVSPYSCRLLSDSRVLGWTRWGMEAYNAFFTDYKTTFIDTHCHLDFLFMREPHGGSFADYREKNKDTFPSNFAGCVAVFCNPKTFVPDGIWKSLVQESGVWMAMGCHPKSAVDYTEWTEHGLRQCLALAKSKAVALGEIGLDYSKSYHTTAEIQKEVFIRQLRIAQELKLPLVIHCREAEEDCLQIMEEHVPRNYKIHCHCFTGNYESCLRWIQRFPNLFIGLTALVTYHSATDTHQVAQRLPLNRLLLETDAPYFLPCHFSGNKGMSMSHPGLALMVAVKVAELRNVSVEHVLEQVRINTRKMYGI